ncbi:MAG: hypothetical protein V4813_12985 [Gemmatimonadota bacterium]
MASPEGGFSAMADGPSDLLLASGDVSLQQAASAAQSATGSRTSGHVGFSFSPPVLGLVSERYSFVALSTGPAAALAAKGEFEMMLTTATGVEQRVHGDVICMNTVGNTTRIAGRLESVWINNVQRPITGATHTIWTVQDNGEGQGTTDTASPMFFNNATNAQLHCTTGFTPPQFTNQDGNIQVHQ